MISAFIEFYRVTSGSLLLLVVPQVSLFSPIGLGCNVLTLVAFIPFHIVEWERERRFKQCLDVNPYFENDNADVEMALEILPVVNKEKIRSMDRIYQRMGYMMILVYSVNILISTIILYPMDYNTLLTLITYLLFIGLKFKNIYFIANTPPYVFYSYHKKNIQYNDVNLKYKLIA